jgi:site-specific DNA-methyltransferase (adenine-specific)
MALAEEFKILSDYRTSNEGVDELALSIERIGLLQPMIVKPIEDPEDDKVRYEIVGGRRRFRAMTEYLKMNSFKKGEHFIVKEGIDCLIAQFQENFERKDFSPVELGKLIQDIHKQKVDEFGHAVRGHSKGWTLKDTGKLIGRDSGFVSRMISIAENQDAVKGCETVSSALETISKAKSKDVQSKVRQARYETQEEEAPPGLDDLIAKVECDNALNFLARIENDSVDLVLTDPPYAINYDKLVQTEEYACYEDDPEEIKELLANCIPEYYRIVKPNRYAIVWVAYEWFNWMRDQMVSAGFRVATTPIHWVKLNSSGKSMNPTKSLGSLCEIAIYGWKGDGELVLAGKGNTFPEAIVRSNRIHPAQKPDKLLEQILPIFTRKNDLVVDTFGGSLSLLRACFNAGRKCLICEKDEVFLRDAINYTRDLYKEKPDATNPMDS